VPSRSFSSPTAGEPVRFELNGETYDCVPILPAGIHLDVLNSGQAQVAGFLDGVLTEESAERFARAIRSPDPAVDLGTVTEIAMWLVEVYTGRPTGPSNGSSPGATPTAEPWPASPSSTTDSTSTPST
jgi:hypothetical protein